MVQILQMNGLFIRVQMNTIKDTIYKGVNYALDPKKRKVVLNGTPFNKNDIIIEGRLHGGWPPHRGRRLGR